MKEIRVNLGNRGYPITIQPGSLASLGDHILIQGLGTHTALISDTTVFGIYGDQTKVALEKSGIHVDCCVVPDGEDSKSLETVSGLYEKLIESRLNRDGVILALGGGVVGDLAGFLAATYLRGIDFIQVPTSLLAQVDSSVGGKVGVNHPKGKNLIGTFYQPRFVLIDPMVLSTLDKRELWSGLGEVVKYALIFDRSFFEFLEDCLDEIVGLQDADKITKVIAFCCRAKADIVEQDEKENGLRRILNFGHTMGHALEAATDFRYFRHGEAVIHGMHWAAWISVNRGFLPESDSSRISRILQRFPTPPIPKELDSSDLLQAARLDKKHTDQGVHLILLEGIGTSRMETMEALSENDINLWLTEVTSP